MNRTEALRGAGCWAAALMLAASARADDAAQHDNYRYRAPITVSAAGAFVQLPLPASAYGRTVQTALRDLLVVDAKNERVPFALLTPRAAEVRSTEQQRDAVLYPLPSNAAPDGRWASPIEIAVRGDNITVKRLGGATPGNVNMLPGGWLIDTGEKKPDQPAAQSLRLAWSGQQEFSAAYRFESSDDLRSWRAGGAGQLLAFSAASGVLTQPTVMLPVDTGRFVRLVWADAAGAPAISAVQVIAATQSNIALDAPTELVFAAGPAPTGKAAADDLAQRALYFDLGGTLPLVQINLRLPPGTRVAPVRVQGRAHEADTWRDLASGVFYRLERGGEISVSPPLALQASARYLRVLPDVRAAALDAAQTQLVVQAQLARLVFVSQGQPPYALLAGAERAPPAALAVATLVPALDDERARFGSATLGDWSEVAEVTLAVEKQQQRAALRPLLLWAVLLAGVAGLGFMVWRLTRQAPPPA